MISADVERDLLNTLGSSAQAATEKQAFQQSINRNRTCHKWLVRLVIGGVLLVTAPNWIEPVLEIGGIFLKILVFVLILPFVFPFFTMRTGK